MHISGLSGNEIYCLAQKGFSPGEIVLGNSVRSVGFAGSLRVMGKSVAGGEIHEFTELISEGRHAAILRMEHEAKVKNASGVTGVTAGLTSFAGFTEFLAQGTAVHVTPVPTSAPQPAAAATDFFSTSASGTELYCHLDAGYTPIRFALGNVAYALGLSRGISGGFRTMARGEVTEYSEMYNEIRTTALIRLCTEAAGRGANSVVDIHVDVRPFGGAVEFLLTGTASHHERLPKGKLRPGEIVTSELTGEEIWNLAKMGLAPKQLVFATSIYSLGVSAGISAMFKSASAGELPDVTALILEAREKCLDIIRREAEGLKAERVIGNRLSIAEIGPGLVEVLAIGTAVQRIDGIAPATDQLITQAVIVDRDIGPIHLVSPSADSTVRRGSWARTPQGPLQKMIVLAVVVLWIGFVLFQVFRHPGR